MPNPPTLNEHQNKVLEEIVETQEEFGAVLIHDNMPDVQFQFIDDLVDAGYVVVTGAIEDGRRVVTPTVAGFRLVRLHRTWRTRQEVQEVIGEEGIAC